MIFKGESLFEPANPDSCLSIISLPSFEPKTSFLHFPLARAIPLWVDLPLGLYAHAIHGSRSNKRRDDPKGRLDRDRPGSDRRLFGTERRASSHLAPGIGSLRKDRKSLGRWYLNQIKSRAHGYVQAEGAVKRRNAHMGVVWDKLWGAHKVLFRRGQHLPSSYRKCSYIFTTVQIILLSFLTHRLFAYHSDFYDLRFYYHIKTLPLRILLTKSTLLLQVGLLILLK